MECYICLFQEYLKINIRYIAARVYLDDIRRKKMLWSSSFLVLPASVVSVWLDDVSVWFEKEPWSLVPFFAVAYIWHHSFMRAFKTQFSRYFDDESKSKRLSLFRERHQYLRYLLFKEKVSEYVKNESHCTMESLVHADIVLSTHYKAGVTSHPFIAFLIAISIGVIGGSVGLWHAAVVKIVLSLLFLILIWGMITMPLVQGEKGKYMEFKRFLLWLKEDV